MYWRLRYRKNGGSTSTDSAITVAANQYYWVELYVKIDGAAGAVALYVDGASIVSDSGFDNDDWTNTQLMVAGLIFKNWNPGAGSTTVYVDCVTASESYIGPEAGVTVKKGGGLASTVAQMLNSKMLFSTCNPYGLKV